MLEQIPKYQFQKPKEPGSKNYSQHVLDAAKRGELTEKEARRIVKRYESLKKIYPNCPWILKGRINFGDRE